VCLVIDTASRSKTKPGITIIVAPFADTFCSTHILTVASHSAPLQQPQPQPPQKVAKAPDGNGGLYRALHTSGALSAMQAAGVEALDVYCVDNSLARLGDPEFVGACYSRGAEVGAGWVIALGGWGWGWGGVGFNNGGGFWGREGEESGSGARDEWSARSY